MSKTNSLEGIEKRREKRRETQKVYNEIDDFFPISTNCSDYTASKKYLFFSESSQYKRKIGLTKISKY